jgi:hypothetical protein
MNRHHLKFALPCGMALALSAVSARAQIKATPQRSAASGPA